jgi:phosphatidylglycerol:prolipoprotein diacylglycerol transferase
MLHRGGLAWFGAIIFATICGIIFFKINKMPVLKMMDFFAPFIALGHAIGRIGCFLNGCCYGKEAVWGIYFSVHQARLIPTQLFSSLYLIIIFLILRFLQEKPHRLGEIFFSYLLLYSFARFFIEFLRADSLRILAGLTSFQLISIFIFLGSLYAITFIKGRS